MMLLLLSAVLAVLPLVGLVYLWWVFPAVTIENIFATLIGLAISSLFGLNLLIEAYKMFKGGEEEDIEEAAIAAGQITRSASSTRRERGVVASVAYFESGIGMPNHSVVMLKSKDQEKVLKLLGDLRDQFPIGRRVEVTYRPDSQGLSMVERKVLVS